MVDDLSPQAPEDRELWQELARMWQTRDPMPERLVEHVLVALATEDLDAEYELLHLVSRSSELTGARGGADALTMTFSGDDFSLLLRVSATGSDLHRVDGWVTPAQEMRVTVRQRDSVVEADVDGSGRFEIPRLPGGPCRLWLAARGETPSSRPHELFATPTFDL